jgi:hydroxymethylpyrimidine pyrophosphatase-like HAD family hydrolase
MKKLAFVTDLDGTLNHAEPLPDGLLIRGLRTDSCLSRQTLALLLELAKLTDIYIATGRSRAGTADFREHFAKAGLRIAGWILEHGAVVDQHPAWQESVLAGIDLAAVRPQLEELARQHGLSVKVESGGSHQAALRCAVRVEEQTGFLFNDLPAVRSGQFRIAAEPGKIVLVPRQGDKYAAFQAVFGGTHCMACTAGDRPDDLTLLQHAAFPMTLAGASSVVQQIVRQRGGFIAASAGHEGTAALLEAALAQFNAKAKRLSASHEYQP